MSEPESAAAQPETRTRRRLRVTFARDETLKYIGHLDMALTWQRILRRAGLPLAYSEGFNPQPKITFAAALPVGCVSNCEIMDVVLEDGGDLDAVSEQLKRALPPGIKLISIAEAPLNAPALQVQLAAAEYEIAIGPDQPIGLLPDRVREFLSADEVMRSRRGKLYNLRPLVQSLEIDSEADRVVVRTRLQATETGTGRPDELIAALGADPATAHIRRTGLIFLDKTT